MSTPADDQKLLYLICALDTYLRQRFNYRSQLCEQGLGQTITVCRRAVGLYIRFKPGHHDAEFDRPLVIARMRFHKTRCGHGTDLLRFLVSKSEEFGFGCIILESTNEESTAFAEAFGFTLCSDVMSNWHAPISGLQALLSNTSDKNKALSPQTHPLRPTTR